MKKKRKIAVIGGGVGAITAAYAITQQPNWQTEYDITIYQLGWRLGGKGASGRNMDHAGRIEEHGLHIWAGFYENGFRLMRDCYDQLNLTGLRSPDAPLGTIDKAFTGLNHFLLAEEITTNGKTNVHPWLIEFEPNDDIPGEGSVLPSPFGYLQELLEAVVKFAETVMAESKPRTAHKMPDRFEPNLSRKGIATEQSSPLHHMREFVRKMPEAAEKHTPSDLMVLADMSRHAQEWLATQEDEHGNLSDEARRLKYMIDLSLAFFRGAIDNGLFLNGFDAIDDHEISQWLLDYGASKEAVYSALFRGCYDYVFGYPGGITDHRSVGAGTAIRGLLRLAFTYKGSLFFKMTAGMGDTIFGPYYQILKHRGVKFKFFNAARKLTLDPTKTYINGIEMVEQAELKGDDYDPFVDVKGLPCWPSQPLWDQLKNGAALKRSGINFESEKEPPTGKPYTLLRGKDFDDVILGASLGSLPYLASDLIAASNRWKLMMEKVQTVATHAAQFWLDKPAKDLGWDTLVAKHNNDVPADLETVMTSYVEPLDTWADLSELIPAEDWKSPPPVALAYFCSPAKDAGVETKPFKERVKEWADKDLVRLWPKAKKAGGFDLDLLHSETGTTGEEKFESQYFRENFFGSERYVLSVPGSVQYRLPPDGTGFVNLYAAGDWTRCGINAGCVEAATISGLAAARGLTGADIEIVGEGDVAIDKGPGAATRLASPYAQNANWPLTPFFGVGEIDGFFSFHAVDSNALQQVLPKGMTLHPQVTTPEGTHPVSILANQQIDVRPSILPRPFGFRNYNEAIIAINDVQVSGHEGVFAYLPNLYLNSKLPQIAGVLFYGYNKRFGKLTMGNNHYSVESEYGSPIWSGRYAQRDVPRPLTEYGSFGEVSRLVNQVVVTQNQWGKWQFSNLDFSLTSAQAAGVHAQIDVQNAHEANLPAGRMIAQPIQPYGEPRNPQSSLPGAFRIWTSWTLSNPLDSTRIARLEAARNRL
ncbi:NAD(P)-binding protein [Loktanella sp. S4079]|uniref:NAD(P)-binding protein n=1 Tax=Loktanella sp. S4079 TaxID=579483 RepID=UPI0006991A56|nr:NAD(P)-binding protein [Loktanella sp. S4079]